MKIRNKLLAFLGLFAIGLASCNNDTKQTPTKISEEDAEFLEAVIDNNAPEKKMVIKKELKDGLAGDANSSLSIVLIDPFESYLYEHETSSNGIKEVYAYKEEDTYIYLIYTDFKLTYWDYSSTNILDIDTLSNIDIFATPSNMIKYFISIEGDNPYTNIYSYNLNKKGVGNFNLSVSGEKFWPTPRTYKVDFSFENGLITSYSSCDDVDGKKVSTTYKYSYDLDFEKKYPDITLEELKQMRAEQFNG